MAKILIVDDEPNIREILGHLLECIGHTPIEAGSGLEALKLCDEGDLDVVITDLTMPDFSGMELIREIRANYPDIRIVAVSGNSDRYPGDGLFAAKQAGASATVQKPFALNDIRDAIDLVLSPIRIEC